MINHALEYLRVYLDQFIEIPNSTNGESNSVVELQNIATINDGDSAPGDALIISLVNVEEEYTKKNYPNRRIENAAGNVEYRNPPIFLNLYLLFCAKVENYSTAIEVLSNVISCFQSKNSFTVPDSGLNITESDISFSTREEQLFRIELELYTLTFEQLNHLWGTLGGKQYPSVLYKTRLVQLEKEVLHGRGKVIETVTFNEKDS